MANSCVGINEEWESHITKFVKMYKSFYDIQNIIDVGANFGYHTLFFAQECNVFAFEPQSQNYQLLVNNINNNNVQNITYYNFACGDVNCDVNMPIIEGHAVCNMGDFTPNITSNKFSTTKCVLLDEINFPPIGLIKIDVQGWEKKVLSGALNLLNTCKPALIVEFEHFQLAKLNISCAELFDFIRKQNYYIFYLDYRYPSDHVCIHNDNLHDFRLNFNSYIFNHTEDNTINYNFSHGVTEKISF
jgi:FkbM family methyltransferase